MISHLMMSVNKGRPVRVRLAGAWTSTNKSHSSTQASPKTFADLEVGDKLEVFWRVSSESNYDWLRIFVSDVERLKESGAKNGTYVFTATTAGKYSVHATYSKDGSISQNSDLGQYDWIDQVNRT